ncbi:alpha/beta fold hydrolase [Edaphobacter bradus]|uniref:alpha/beta fold hydrolase n=1 Tax=Edaphobacter bradus TaxID=2259016 RepID=UPI0021E0CEE2|nr:alpha/beta hydrolase [Edaphobacter bradus]
MRTGLRILSVVVLVLVVGGLVFYFHPLWVTDQQLRLALWREGVKSDYVEAGGYRLHYFEAQPAGGGGTPLLLVHGLGARGEDWAKMIPALAAQGFHVYVPDLLGYGRSQKPDVSYSISMEEDVVVKYMQAMHLAKADVGGWSMGGWISMKLALDHPELVDRLVVYDSAGIYFPASFGPELFVPADQAGITQLMKMLSPHPRVVPGFVGEAILRRIAGNGWVVERSMSAMTNGHDLLDFRLHDVKEPTLVVWGSHDDLIPLSTGEKIHGLIPGSSLLVVDGCGHLAPAECWKPVVKGTVEFLKAESPATGGEKTVAGN